jgi:colicin import membrane protein
MSTLAANAYTIPPEPGRAGAWFLAAVMHMMLFSFLWIGIRWQNEAPITVEAEVWDTKIAQAAPKLTAPPPEPEVKPEPRPEPKPLPKVEPQVEAPRPDIVLEQKRKKEREQKLAEQEKLREKEKEKEKAKERLAKQEQEKLDKKQQEKLDKAAKAEKAKLAAQKEKQEQAAAEKEREANLRRLTGNISGNGNPSATGDAARSTGPRGDPGYAQLIRAKIKSNLSFDNANIPGNPKVIFKIDLLPTGEIIGARMLKSSGIPAFDDAVEKAIAKSSPLPKKKDGSMDRDIEATFNLKE